MGGRFLDFLFNRKKKKNNVCSFVLDQEIEKLNLRNHEYFLQYIDRQIVYDVQAPDDNICNVEIQVFWDNEVNGDIRVIASVSESGKFNTFLPISRDLIIQKR